MPVKKRKSKKKGLYANIHAKRKRIKAGSGERMRKPEARRSTAANAKEPLKLLRSVKRNDERFTTTS